MLGLTLPNALTLLRLLLAPLFVVVYCTEDQHVAAPFFLFGLLAISECTDAIDGFLARRYRQISEFGKIFDPIIDSISRLTLYFAFLMQPVGLPIGIVLIFFYRDSLIGGLRVLCALRGEALAARSTGKIKAIIQSISLFTIVILMIPHSYGVLSGEELGFYATGMASLSAAASIISGLEYLYTYRQVFVQSMQIPNS